MHNINRIKIVVVGVFTALTVRLGNLAVPLYLLVAFMILDYYSALRAAKFRKQKIDSNKGIRGIEKKVFMLILVLIGGLADIFIRYLIETIGLKIPLVTPIAIAVCLWLITNEVISLLENIKDILGDRMPDFLTKFFVNIKSKIKDIEPEGDNEDESDN